MEAETVVMRAEALVARRIVAAAAETVSTVHILVFALACAVRVPVHTQACMHRTTRRQLGHHIRVSLWLTGGSSCTAESSS